MGKHGNMKRRNRDGKATEGDDDEYSKDDRDKKPTSGKGR
jgi:hypothetical protein